MTIKSASYSRLVDYESCPRKAYLKHVDRIPDPRPSPAADRGTAIHLTGEQFIKGERHEVPDGFIKFAEELEALQRGFAAGIVDAESEWGFDKTWTACDWKEAWFRVKADAVMRLTPVHAAVIDFKTGKKFGNEVKHGEQLQLYALATFLMYPELKDVTAELWYLDQDELSRIDVTREIAMKRYLKVFDTRARKMTEASQYPANPNIYSCKYCPYGDTGHCDLRVVDTVATNNFYKRKHGGS